jgi:hypothetical protein
MSRKVVYLPSRNIGKTFAAKNLHAAQGVFKEDIQAMGIDAICDHPAAVKEILLTVIAERDHMLGMLMAFKDSGVCPWCEDGIEHAADCDLRKVGVIE